MGSEQTLTVVADPAAAIPPAARTAATDYQDKVAKLQRSFTGAPTGTQQLNYGIAFDELAAEITRLRALEAEIRKFEQQMEAAGVAYTPGRWPGQ